MALDVDRVRKTVDLILRKNQIGGYLKTADFNRLAEKVQYIWFDNKRRQFESNFQTGGDLSSILKESDIKFSAFQGRSVAATPSDWWQQVSATSKSYFKVRGEQEVRHVPMTWVTDAEFDSLVGGDAFRPDNDHPIIKETVEGLEVFPANINEVRMFYIRQPIAPVWVGTVANNREVYDSALSTQFEVPNYAFTDIVSLILREMGVSVRDGEVAQYGQATAFTDGNK